MSRIIIVGVFDANSKLPSVNLTTPRDITASLCYSYTLQCLVYDFAKLTISALQTKQMRLHVLPNN